MAAPTAIGATVAAQRAALWAQLERIERNQYAELLEIKRIRAELDALQEDGRD